ncbi:MAG TPA: Rossmann-like fold-containing protein, partial [Kofleriaceae bacterium]
APRPGELEPQPRSTGGERDQTATPAHDETHAPAQRLASNDAVVEQLAHGMVDRDLTPADEAFLQANGYRTEPPIRGEHQFVMRVFYPTEEGKPPIVAFRGTVPSKPATIIADLDPRGIGTWQFNANRSAIEHAVNKASEYGPVVFAGHSLGGALAQTAASHFPAQADRIVTFQAPGVSRGTVRAVEDFNAAHPDNPILSTHHRVTGDLVPRGGRALTPGTVYDHEMFGGSRLSRNPLSKHTSLPLAQEEIAAGHQVPISRDGQQFRSTGDHSTAEDNAGKNQVIENVRTGLGGVIYGPGLAVSSVRRLFGPPRERTSLPTGEPVHELPPGETLPHEPTGSNEPLPPPAPRPGAEIGLPPPAPRPGEHEPTPEPEAGIPGQQEPHRVLAVGESTFEYSQALRNQLDAEGAGQNTDIIASGLQGRQEALGMRANQNVTEPLVDGPGYHIQHQVDATRLEEKFEPNSLDRIIWNNPEAPDTGAVINDLLKSAPKVLRPGGQINIGTTASPRAKGADVLAQHVEAGTITVEGHRYQVTVVPNTEYPYAVSYPSRRTTGGRLRRAQGPKLYYIFKLLD